MVRRAPAFEPLTPTAFLSRAAVVYADRRVRLAGFKALEAYEMCEELPKTLTGKVRKFILRERAENPNSFH
jgi:acyl-coenzyme A synthetase/AMP-(fatty) acid ligase